MKTVLCRKLLAGTFIWAWLGCLGATVLPQVWNVRTSPSLSQLNGVAYGNGWFVAVGSDTTILTSPDGINWTARSAGTTAPTLAGVAWGSGRYVVGGGEGALIRSSVNGIDWTNGLSTIGIEHINGIVFGYSEFVAVGNGPQPNSGYLLTSSNGLDWISQSVPTTNALFGISPAFAEGVGWADEVYVAVGDRGTILTSTNGVNWTLCNSGTTVPLRSVVWHGGFRVGGDNGTSLTSADGISWTVAAPTSFHIRGLTTAGLGGAVVAVGNYFSQGRIHASTDGLTWPGADVELPQPLNGIAYGGGTFVAVGNGGLIVQSIVSPLAATNEWTKTTSGYWEEAYWSLGLLPSIDQGTVAFRNPGWKALAIGSNTTANYADSLALNDLVVDGPTNSVNQLLLNWAGLSVPLFVHSNFIIGPNGSLASHYSALRAGNFYVSGPVSFSDGATATADRILLGTEAAGELALNDGSVAAGQFVVGFGAAGTVNQSGGTIQTPTLELYSTSVYNLNHGTAIATNVEVFAGGTWNVSGGTLSSTSFEMANASAQLTISGGAVNADFIRIRQLTLSGGSLRSDQMEFRFGQLTQTGGTNTVQTMLLPDHGELPFSGSGGTYALSGGTLISSNISVGWAYPFAADGPGSFQQSGGAHINTVMTLWGDLRPPGYAVPYGFYTLSGGLLASDRIDLLGGKFVQSGGTNRIHDLKLQQGGAFLLSAGDLVTSNTTLTLNSGVDEYFTQTGGVHTVQNRLLVEGMYVRYSLSEGTLLARAIEVGPNAQFRLLGGVISNSTLFTIHDGGAVLVGSVTNRCLGKIQIDANSSVATLDMNPFSFYAEPGPTVLQFQDSHEVAWSGSLQVLNWSGSEHLFVGTNSQGLTPAQLSQVAFVNPIGWPMSPYGWPPSNYSAVILPTGELIPTQPPLLAGTNTAGGLILSWPGSYELVTATNLAGPYLPMPGATSPWTVRFTDPQRYFRLQMPGL